MSQEHQKVIWQADSTHPQLAESAREMLRQVIDPEIGLSVIELGLVRDLEIEDDQAKMMMIMTTPFCPYGPALLEMARKKAEEAVNRPMMIELGMDMWEPSMMEEGAGAEWGFF